MVNDYWYPLFTKEKREWSSYRRFQRSAIVATYLFVGIVSYILIKVVKVFISVRANEQEESLGLDITLHGEKAYHEA